MDSIDIEDEFHVLRTCGMIFESGKNGENVATIVCQHGSKLYLRV